MRLIKRTLFNEYSETKQLNSVTEAIKGIYSAIRLNDVCAALSAWFTALTMQ
jgi:eukaryotic translation initiation factor 2C